MNFGNKMSDTKNEKNEKLTEIKSLIHGFCEINLNPELEGYCFKLCDALGRKRKVDILRSTTAQWAASIIYVVGRLNFLFDPENAYNITADTICDHFQTKKTTTGNKATQIQKLCNLSMGAEGYCSDDIRDLFTFYQTESGFIIPKFMMNETRRGNDLTDFEDEIVRLLGNSKMVQEQKQKKKNQQNKDDNQLGLFENE